MVSWFTSDKVSFFLVGGDLHSLRMRNDLFYNHILHTWKGYMNFPLKQILVDNAVSQIRFQNTAVLNVSNLMARLNSLYFVV